MAIPVLLTVKEVAAACKVTSDRVYDWFHLGLPSVTFGIRDRRVRPQDLDEWIEKHRR